MQTLLIFIQLVRSSWSWLKDHILGFIFPKSELVSELEQMSADDVLKKASYTGNLGGVLPNIRPLTTALLRYRDPYVHAAIQEIKYKKNTRIAKLLGEILAKKLGELPVVRETLIIPIPLSPERLRERSYNQLDLVLDATEASEKAARLNFTIRRDLLVKTRHTAIQSQSESREERQENLRGCFMVTKFAEIDDKNIILFDDVITTGSTFDEAARALRKAGAADIQYVALAH